MSRVLDILVPTCDRAAALAVTLGSLDAQTFRDFRVVISDQGDLAAADDPVVVAVVRLLEAHGRPVEMLRHLPRRGMAEQRQFLLDHAHARYALFLDDDVVLEPDLVARMVEALDRAGCGFVGCGLIGLSYADDVRPAEQRIEFWDGPVEPEVVTPETPAWDRHKLHNAANLLHVQQALGLTAGSSRLYKVAWVGGCVMYDVEKLRAVDGFGFWKDLPTRHCGEDVLAQQRVMARFGGAGLLPTGAYHQELPTRVEDRTVDAPRVLPLEGRAPGPVVTVVMPTFNQAQFIRRAVESLLTQRLTDWELVVIDDGSTDGTAEALARYLDDPRIRLFRHPRNRGLGAALNHGLDVARGRFIAYLPSDDVYYAEHLAGLAAMLDEAPSAVLAYAGVRHHYNRTAPGRIDGHPLQLVQVMHRKVDARWLERETLTTDDLDRMYWDALSRIGGWVGLGHVTCEWVDHPHQRHKIVREPVGGINLYRQVYGVQEPLRFHTTCGNLIDEVGLYARSRERDDTPMASDGLRILLVGELAYNADRVLALEARGHRLYGLWMRDPYWYNTVGPLPFGHCTEVPYEGWREAVRRIKPDLIYALLNWQAVPFCHEVMRETTEIPFVWHFKEGPFICLEKGTWPQLVELYTDSDGQIYCSPEMQRWFASMLPECGDDARSLVLDGDLPKADWFAGARTRRISLERDDGSLHTVVPGRPIGLHPHTVVELARENVHLHFYGDFTHGQWREWIEKTRGLAPGYLHIHPNVDPSGWVTEFSRYDAGWLHFFQSENHGDIRRANWDDLNYPARMGTLLAAGLPTLQRANPGHAVATQSLVRSMQIGLFFDDMADLAARMRDEAHMAQVRDSVERHRLEWTFDAHVDRLTAFFHRIIERRGGRQRRNGHAASAMISR